jgi:hypothetical protein
MTESRTQERIRYGRSLAITCTRGPRASEVFGSVADALGVVAVFSESHGVTFGRGGISGNASATSKRVCATA